MATEISPLLRRCIDRSIAQVAYECHGVFWRETVARHLANLDDLGPPEASCTTRK
jgi:hypothetical protein